MVFEVRIVAALEGGAVHKGGLSGLLVKFCFSNCELAMWVYSLCQSPLS